MRGEIYALKSVLDPNTIEEYEIYEIESLEHLTGSDTVPYIVVVEDNSPYLKSSRVKSLWERKRVFLINESSFRDICSIARGNTEMLKNMTAGLCAIALGVYKGLVDEEEDLKKLEELWEKSSFVVEEGVLSTEAVLKSGLEDINVYVYSGQAQFSALGNKHIIYFLLKVARPSGKLLAKAVFRSALDKKLERSEFQTVLSGILSRIREALIKHGEFEEGEFELKLSDDKTLSVKVEEVTEKVGESIIIKDKEKGKYISKEDIKDKEKNIKNPLLFIDKEVHGG